MTQKEKIAEILYNELDYIYCNTCKYTQITREEAEEKFDYYGCDDCYRKYMGWEISKNYAEEIAEEIINELNKKTT